MPRASMVVAESFEKNLRALICTLYVFGKH
jgi:hypothetical protein